AEAQKLRRVAEEADLEYARAEIPRALARVQDGTERVTKIVRAMKEFAHPDEAEHAPADINHLLTTTLTVAHNEYKHVATVETRFEELPLVTCNAGELSQVFLNLLINAAHAVAETSAGTHAMGTIEIRTRRDGPQVVV